MFEEQQKREKAKERELKLLQDDLKSLRRELGGIMKSEVSSLIEDKDSNLKVIDKKLFEMKTMVTESLTHKDDHKDWVKEHEKMQDTKLTDLKSHINDTLVDYKKDLDSKLKKMTREKDKVKESLQSEISTKENELSIYKNKIDQLKTEVNKSHEQVEYTENQLKEARTELKTMKDQNSNSSRRKIVIEDELSVFKKHNEGLLSQNDKFNGRIKKLEQEIDELNSQIGSKGGEMNSKIFSLKREIKEKNENIDLQNQELNKLKSEKKNLNEKIEELTEDRDKYKSELEAKVYLSEKDKGKHTRELGHKIQSLELKLKTSNKEVKEKDNEINKLKSGVMSNRVEKEETKIENESPKIKKKIIDQPNTPKKTALTKLLIKYSIVMKGILYSNNNYRHSEKRRK